VSRPGSLRGLAPRPDGLCGLHPRRIRDVPLLTARRRSRDTGGTYPWIVESAAMVNHINGHEYLKRQLAKRVVAFEALDNGIKSCADPKLMQQVCDEVSAGKIDACCANGSSACGIRFRP
jgi:hypothetical protein